MALDNFPTVLMWSSAKGKYCSVSGKHKLWTAYHIFNPFFFTILKWIKIDEATICFSLLTWLNSSNFGNLLEMRSYFHITSANFFWLIISFAFGKILFTTVQIFWTRPREKQIETSVLTGVDCTPKWYEIIPLLFKQLQKYAFNVPWSKW